MLTIFALQLGVPMLLAIWMLRYPPRSAVGTGIQVAVSLLVLLALFHIGIWLFPPWWTPHLAAAAIGLGATLRLRHPGQLTVWPTGKLAWWAVALWLGVALGVTPMLGGVWRGHQSPAGDRVMELQSPLRNGRYLVVNGGSALLVNAHRASSDTANTRLQPWRGNGHAVDLVAINWWGARARGIRPTDPTRYLSFGVAVLAPCSGTVVVAVDGMPDMAVPEWDRTNMAGNHVLLSCGGAHVLLGHLQRHSVSVALGDSVQAGDSLGTIGNSGGSDEPHLHMHVQRPGPPNAPLAGDPIPIRIDGRYLVRGMRLRVH